MYSMISPADESFSDRHWQEYFNLLKALHERYKSRFRPISWQQLKSRHLSFFEKEKFYFRSVISDKSGPVGWIIFWIMNYGTPGQMALLEFDALHDAIPDRLTRTAGRWYFDQMNEHDCSKALIISVDKRITAFARNLNSKQLNRFDDYILRTENVNMGVIEEWLRTIPEQNKDLRLEFHCGVPEEHIPALAGLLTETLGDMPEERDSDIPSHADPDEMRKTERWRRENGIPIYICLLFNDKNEMVALSNVDVDLSNTGEIEQKMTGVTRAYRGRGLSKWLKAEMFLRLRKEFPENKTIVTNMRAVNKPIQKVNAQMGFELEREGFEFQVTMEGLEKYLTRTGD